MRLYVDLHIHTCLSPCADDDMTPCNITAMAALKGLDAIAICDHNSAYNVRACMAAGARRGVLVVPGMELTTREDVHVLCYFPHPDALDDFAAVVRDALTCVRNNPELFGNQWIVDETDKIRGNVPNLLIAATDLSIEGVNAAVRMRGGVMVPAHVDKGANSLLHILGMLPPGLDIHTVELYHEHAPAGVESLRHIRCSDAHSLGAILEPTFTLETGERSVAAIVAAL